MKTKIRKIGNSAGVTLNKSLLEDLDLEVDDPVEVVVEGNVLKIVSLKHPHKRWEEWFSKHAKLQTSNLVPLDESPNKFDSEDWTW